MSRKKADVLNLYNLLLRAYGSQEWWPGQAGPFEVVVGAVLTQRTTWANAASAIEALRRADALTPDAMLTMDARDLELLIRSAGFQSAKARTLKTFCDRLSTDHAGSLDQLLALPLTELRETLLSIEGVGDETADAILVYAAGYPSFVIDAYTRQLLERLEWIDGNETYHQLQEFFSRSLPADVELFAEYHALIVQHGKVHCRKRPQCGGCPVARKCAFVKRAQGAG